MSILPSVRHPALHPEAVQPLPSSPNSSATLLKSAFNSVLACPSHSIKHLRSFFQGPVPDVHGPLLSAPAVFSEYASCAASSIVGSINRHAGACIGSTCSGYRHVVTACPRLERAHVLKVPSSLLQLEASCTLRRYGLRMVRKRLWIRVTRDVKHSDRVLALG